MAKRKRYEDLMLLAPGEIIPGHQAQFTIDRVVGTGAFAAVYLAHDAAAPGRQIALKEFYPASHPREQANLKALFDRERYVGQQASRHPLMPTFYEAFPHDGHFYIAQEFIQGETLDEIILKRHPLPREWTLKWAVSLCDALAFLHSRQIVHHDLKPANIRINPLGHLTLLDFGAAQYFGQGHENDAPTELYGTEGYLPPELEADGDWVADVRTDIFALGCILYEMVAGVAPDQDSINERSMYVTNSLIQQPNADLNLVKLINQAVSYNTEFRYASANAFLLELRKIAPPVLLVSHKHLRYGEVRVGETVPPRSVTLYNAGGGEIRGEVKPRAPWIKVPFQTFKGNQHTIPVQIDVGRISERGQLVTGSLEINMPDVRDASGTIVSSGDRWFVECLATVTAKRGVILVRGRETDTAPPLGLAGRKGQPATGVLELYNDGDAPVEYQIVPDAGLLVTPASGRLDGSQTATLSVTRPDGPLAPGQTPTVTIRTSARQNLVVPFAAGGSAPPKETGARNGAAKTPAPAGKKPPSIAHLTKGITPAMTRFALPAFVVLLLVALAAYVISHRASTEGGPPELPAFFGGRNMLKPTNDPANWILEQYGGATTMQADGDALRVTMNKADGNYYRIQFYQAPISLVNGKAYTLSFRAKSNKPRDLPVNASKNEPDYLPVGLTEHFKLTRDWKTFTIHFIAKGALPKNNRVPSFLVGQKAGVVWVADVKLVAD